ncbi:FliM/FliN family flagellar motor switch protein [Erwinia tasmaniensis]|uniref:Type III secretion apparatus n=1 Tax=Erwinia tasmaniensis (strain DSM 17950 / CFBP 7177 / CIP 109463 / NCPPB 4357 / Et1/99) TaxID=465817 RepID=B2VEE9_ERWT9|nr:FliM/FliN family flagellar motor switch protein [Erwinia tasmaniensis]CAO96947.1 Type III secretion apparatus [Erwinia tasmaniensis Et1/99]
MNLRTHLRLRKEIECGTELLKIHHPGSEITELEQSVRYLSLSLYNKDGVYNTALLNVDMWLQESDYELPGIPWHLVPLNYIRRLLETLQLTFLIGSEIWEMEGIKLPPQNLPSEVLSLPARPYPLLCHEWLESHNSLINTLYLRKCGIPFVIDVILGYSQLPVIKVVDVAKGDLLLIQHQSGYLQIGSKKIFILDFVDKKEIVVLDKLTDYEDHYRDEEEKLFSWSDLSVEIEFVLDSKSYTLTELDAIHPGMILPLNQDAEKRVKIYLNKKFFARGELVALESGNLAVEINQINKDLTNEMDIPDVEQ